VALADKRTAVYRLYGVSDLLGTADALLYVGITTDPRDRWYRHSKKKPWWPEVARKAVTWYPTRAEALIAEAEAIRDESPFYNLMTPDPADPLHWSIAEFAEQQVEGSRRARAYRAMGEFCPVCRHVLPPKQICPGCGEAYYRSEKGQLGAKYCSERCADRARSRIARGRAGLPTEGLTADQIPERVAQAVHALMEACENAGGGPLTVTDICKYDNGSVGGTSTGSALAHARRFGFTAVQPWTGHPGLWSATELAWKMRSIFEDRISRLGSPRSPHLKVPTSPPVRRCARPECGAEFQFRKTSAIYCSRRCNELMYSRRARSQKLESRS
jgi:hypothetical protein